MWGGEGRWRRDNGEKKSKGRERKWEESARSFAAGESKSISCSKRRRNNMRR